MTLIELTRAFFTVDASFIRIHHSLRYSCRLFYSQFSRAAKKDYTCLGELNPVFKWYEIFSTYYMIYIIFKTLIPATIDINRLELPRPTHCYLVGRLNLLTTWTSFLPFLIAAGHLIWRWIFRCRKQYMRLDLMMFLLHDERELLEGLKDPQANDFLKAILYNEVVTSDGEVDFFLKFNRNKNAREIMIRRIATVTRLASAIMLCAIAVVACYTVPEPFRHSSYIDRYPGCESKILTVGSSSWSWHRVVASTFDMTETFIVYFDTAMGIATSVTLSYLINYDLIVYCRELNAKLDRVNRLLVMNYSEPNNFVRRNTIYELKFTSQHLRHTPTTSGRLFDLPYFFSNELSRRFSDNSLDLAVLITQREIIEFFKQYSHCTKIMNMVLSVGAITWVATTIVTSYIMVKKSTDGSHMLLELRLIQILMFIIMAAQNYFIQDLETKKNRAYRQICSAMALDRSNYKLDFIRILEFYVSSRRVGYKMFGLYLYRPTSFLSLTGWCVSGSFLVDNIFGNRR